MTVGLTHAGRAVPARGFEAELAKSLKRHIQGELLNAIGSRTGFTSPHTILNMRRPQVTVGGVQIQGGNSSAHNASPWNGASTSPVIFIPGVDVYADSNGGGFVQVGGVHIDANNGQVTMGGIPSWANADWYGDVISTHDLSPTDPVRHSWITEVNGDDREPPALRSVHWDEAPVSDATAGCIPLHLQRAESRFAELGILAKDIRALVDDGHTRCRVRREGEKLVVDPASDSLAEPGAYREAFEYLRTLDVLPLRTMSDRWSRDSGPLQYSAALPVDSLLEAVETTRTSNRLTFETLSDLNTQRNPRASSTPAVGSPLTSSASLERSAPTASELYEMRTRLDGLSADIWDIEALHTQLETRNLAHAHVRLRDGVWHLDAWGLADRSEAAQRERKQASLRLEELGLSSEVLTPSRLVGESTFEARELSTALKDIVLEKRAAHADALKEEATLVAPRRSVSFSSVDDVRVFEEGSDAGMEEPQAAGEGDSAGNSEARKFFLEYDRRMAAAMKRSEEIMRGEREKTVVSDGRTLQPVLPTYAGAPAWSGGDVQAPLPPPPPPMMPPSSFTGSPESSAFRPTPVAGAAPGGPSGAGPASTGSTPVGDRASRSPVNRPKDPPPPPPKPSGLGASVRQSSVSSADTSSRTPSSSASTLQQERSAVAAPGIGRGVVAPDIYREKMAIHEGNYHELVRSRNSKDATEATFDLSDPQRKKALMGFLSTDRQVSRDDGYADVERQVTVEIRATPFSVIGADRVLETGTSSLKLVGLETKKVILQQLPNHEESVKALRALQSQLDALPADAERKVYLKSDAGRNLRISEQPEGTVRKLGGLLPGQSGSAGQAWSLLETLGVQIPKGRGAAISVGELGRLLRNAISLHTEALDAMRSDDADDTDSLPDFIPPPPPSPSTLPSDDEGSENWSDGDGDDGMSVLDLRGSRRGSLTSEDGSIGGASMNRHRVAGLGFDFEDVADARRSSADGLEARRMSGDGGDMSPDGAHLDAMPVFHTWKSSKPAGKLGTQTSPGRVDAMRRP